MCVFFWFLILQFIRDQYNEDPANYNKACLELEQLRQVRKTTLLMLDAFANELSY